VLRGVWAYRIGCEAVTFDDPCMRPRYRDMTDPHDGNTGDGPPSIRVISYLGDYDDYFDVNLIGPYGSASERDAEVRRLGGLPGVYGKVEFVACSLSLTQLGFSCYDAEPGDVARAGTFREFMAGFKHDDEWLTPDEDDADYVEPVADPYEPHPAQIGLFS
jgi:hypothetical protein